MSDEDLVTFFGQKMSQEWADALHAAQSETHYVSEDAKRYRRIAYGDERFRDPVEAAALPCRHCHTLKGKLHEPGCDYEQCPSCGQQIMSCDCEFLGHEWRGQES